MGHDSDTIRRAVDILTAPDVDQVVLDTAVTPLTTLREITDWMTRAAKHIDGRPYCCRTVTGRCAYAGHAFAAARRVLEAAGFTVNR
jgi:hypothetical protein